MADNLLTRLKNAVTTGGDDEKHGASQMLDRMWNSAFETRSQLDWKWFQYDLWYNGNHYARYDKNLQQIVSLSPKSDSRPKATVNKVYSTLRGVRSYVLKNSPKPEVTPFNMTDQDVDQATRINRYLDYLHDHLHLRSQLRASMLHALKYSVGWWQILWDETAENGNGGIIVNVVDPYDLYIDPVARLPKEARYFILAVRRPIDDLKNDPKYKDADWDSVVSTDNLAASVLKSRVLAFERGTQQLQNNDGEKDHGSVILKEFWYKEPFETTVEVDDPTKPGKTMKVKQRKDRIMIAAKVGNVIVRQPEDTKLDRFPFFRLCSDIEPLSMYGQGWVKNLIPLNKMLELNESSEMEYNVIVNKGRYKMTKNAGVKSVTNQHGIFLEHKVGALIEPLAVPPLSPVIDEQIARINQYIEDIGCLHDASRGQSSPNAVSGVSIEALQEGDSNNLSELTENTEEFLEDCYEYMLFLLSQKLVLARSIITSTETGEKEFFKVIGEEAGDDLQNQPNTVVVPKECTVNVQIASELAYTSDGRRAAMKDLASFPQMQSLPPDVILKAYNIGPIADIVKQMKQQQDQQMQQQAQMEQQQQQAQTQNQMTLSAHNAQLQQQQQAQQAALQSQQQAKEQQQEQANQPQGAPDMGQHQAIAFIRQVINAIDNGAPVPDLPKPLTPSFIQYLREFEASPECQANPDLAKAMELITDHAIMQMENQGGLPQQAAN